MILKLYYGKRGELVTFAPHAAGRGVALAHAEREGLAFSGASNCGGKTACWGLLPAAAVVQEKRGYLMASQDDAYWDKTRTLMIITLAVWFFFSFIIHFFANSLNNIVILGFPLGFYMAAQGSLIVFVVQLFLFAKQQHAIDVKFGVDEK